MEDDDDWYYPNAGKGIPEDQFQQDLEYIQNHPLFMKEVPQDLESHPELKALQNIMFDDTPENIAAHMNVKGNEYYKRMNEGKHFLKEAFRYYTEGIAQNCSNSETNAKLYSNRAAIHMVAKNYRKAIEDADEAIKHNPKMIKPYFRAASSFFELRRYKDAVKKCDAGLEVDPSCDELKQLRITALAEIDKIQKSNISEKYQKSKELDAVLDLCEKKKIVLGKPLYEIPNVDAKFHFDADGIFHVPIILAYPEFRQTDIIRVNLAFAFPKSSRMPKRMILLKRTSQPFSNTSFHGTLKDSMTWSRLNASSSSIRLSHTESFRAQRSRRRD
eukprot:TRINITY_DN107_c0_g1_i5.p1 TRINITY_DN107_c0_g1~~TRINITY_DN107_c0_g1_i5.p1  ORF type:complete len:330 (+),score=79.23 TRINITY_DN107_c0_g1_i5:195-1184(+)